MPFLFRYTIPVEANAINKAPPNTNIDVPRLPVSGSLGRAVLGDSGGFFVMKTDGCGQIAVSGFGSVRELEVKDGQALVVDNGHLVAWDAELDYELSLNTSHSGLLGKLVNSQITGEGIVLKFRGCGKVIVCSRNKGGFLDWIFANSRTEKAPEND